MMFAVRHQPLVAVVIIMAQNCGIKSARIKERVTGNRPMQSLRYEDLLEGVGGHLSVEPVKSKRLKSTIV